MSNFRGYYMKCNDCTFQNPSFKREGFKFAPKLVQVADATTLANGSLTIKVLPHDRRKIWCSFPPMTQAQYAVYRTALKLDEHGTDMYLSIEAYDIGSDTYITDTYYHTDIMTTPVYYQGQQMIKIDDFELIGH